MRINFLLPGFGHYPIGGFKVVYEYANRLTQRGHEVTVIHPADPLVDSNVYKRARRIVKYIAFSLGYKGGPAPSRWFKINPNVKMVWRPSLVERCIPDADVIVSTSWETAEWIAKCSEAKGKKFYLIQHIESDFVPVDPTRVIATWKLPLHKIVISRWLQSFADEMGEESTYIVNGLDFDSFGLDVPINLREDKQLMMLYHRSPSKGSLDGVKAMHIVHNEHPDLKAILFGVERKPHFLPEWISYYQLPDQYFLRELYNKAAIFIAPSLSEGIGAPPMEAMQCGTAVCATDAGGHLEYAIDGETALLSPIGDPSTLAKNIIRLIKDRPMRIKIAEQGNSYIQQFTWDLAVNKIEQCLQGSGQ